jgi:glutathione S-transferase
MAGRAAALRLFGTPTSPYARIARIAVAELQLESEVELVWTATRQPNDPSLAFNPSGRVPFLKIESVLSSSADDSNGGLAGLEDTRAIVEYLDGLYPPLCFPRPHECWVSAGMEATSMAMLDGLCVWAREVLRPPDERSPSIIEHERLRAARLADLAERSWTSHPYFAPSTINLAQLFLFGSLDVERRLPEFDWRTQRPRLVDWHAAMLERPSVQHSAPPSDVPTTPTPRTDPF